MTQEKLRNAVNEAKEKGQVGLLVWSCWRIWDDFGCCIGPGQEHFDFALSQTQKGNEATIYANCCGYTMSGILAIPVEKLLSSDEYFGHILSVCEKGQYDGPITLIPLNELSESS